MAELRTIVKKLLEFFDRNVYYVPRTKPAVFYLADREGGGVLINTPPFEVSTLRDINAVMPLQYVFYPSRFGAIDAAAWRKASGAKVLVSSAEAQHVQGPVDVMLDREYRFSRTIDFLPMSGRTAGSCALRCKNKPGIVFFGPILGGDGCPRLTRQVDDYSFENRMFGALGLQDLKYEYAFTDDFVDGKSFYGPGAASAIVSELRELFYD